MCCKDKKKFSLAKVYRRKNACADGNLNEDGHVICVEDDDGWEYTRDVYVCALPKSSNSRTVDHSDQTTTIWDLEFKFCEGLKSCDRINYNGHWLEFLGAPFNTDKKCKFLKVRAMECEPCCHA